MGTVTRGSDARLANRPFLVFDFPGVESLNKCSYFGNTELKWVNTRYIYT